MTKEKRTKKTRIEIKTFETLLMKCNFWKRKGIKVRLASKTTLDWEL